MRSHADTERNWLAAHARNGGAQRLATRTSFITHFLPAVKCWNAGDLAALLAMNEVLKLLLANGQEPFDTTTSIWNYEHQRTRVLLRSG
jgi:hypothetical protein